MTATADNPTKDIGIYLDDMTPVTTVDLTSSEYEVLCSIKYLIEMEQVTRRRREVIPALIIQR